jgi:hypothetical protein
VEVVMSFSSNVLAGVGLVALLCGGCAGDPAPVAAQPAGLVQEPAQAPAPKPTGLSGEDLEKTRVLVSKMLQADASPFPPYPDPPVKEDVPGDGKMFPLVVTLTSARTGQPLEGVLGTQWQINFTHPRAAFPVEPEAWEMHASLARVSFPTFPPCTWGFQLRNSGGLEVDVDTAIWTQPSSGRLDIAIDDFEWTGRVIGPDGEGVANSDVHLQAKGLRPHRDSARYVRYLSIRNRVTTDEHGRFRVTGMHAGKWLVTFDTLVETPLGSLRPRKVRRLLLIEPGQQGVQLRAREKN